MNPITFLSIYQHLFLVMVNELLSLEIYPNLSSFSSFFSFFFFRFFLLRVFLLCVFFMFFFKRYFIFVYLSRKIMRFFYLQFKNWNASSITFYWWLHVSDAPAVASKPLPAPAAASSPALAPSTSRSSRGVVEARSVPESRPAAVTSSSSSSAMTFNFSFSGTPVSEVVNLYACTSLFATLAFP